MVSKKIIEEDSKTINEMMALAHRLSPDTRKTMTELIKQRGVKTASDWFAVMDILADQLWWADMHVRSFSKKK